MVTNYKFVDTHIMKYFVYGNDKHKTSINFKADNKKIG